MAALVIKTKLNIAIIFLILIFLTLVGILYQNQTSNDSNASNTTTTTTTTTMTAGAFHANCHDHDNDHEHVDILLDPYAPPLIDNRINIETQGCGSNRCEYHQIGILTTPHKNGNLILPLMGRQIHRRRDKWQFYTMSDSHNSVKLPIRHKSRMCTSYDGCDSIYTGDAVFVEGYKESFTATIYETNNIPYML